MPNIIGEEFKEYTANQINLRQKIHGKKNRTNKELLYLNSRTSWIKLASGVEVTQERIDLIPELKGNTNYLGIELAKEFLLFNGTQAFKKNPKAGITGNPSISPNPAYGMLGRATRKFGILPMPGVESVDVKSMEKGSIKRASIKIKAYNKTQFDIIDVLYLRLGYTLLLEWGDSHYLDNNNPQDPITQTKTTLTDTIWFDKEQTSSDQFKMLKIIEEKREKNSGNYDALFGKITNFKWTFENDGTYSIHLEVMSLGDVAESLKMNVGAILEEKDIKTSSKNDKSPKPPVYQPKPKQNIIEQIVDSLRKVSDPYYEAYNNTFTEDLTWDGSGNDENKYKYEQIFNKTDINNEKGKIITIQGTNVDSKNNQEDGNLMGITLTPALIKETLIPDYYSPNSRSLNDQNSIKYHKAIKNSEGGLNDDKVPPIDYIQMNFQPSEYQYYIRFGAFLKLLQDVIFPYYNKEGNQPIIKIDCRVYDNLMYYIPNMISLDPRICLVSSTLSKTDANGSRSEQAFFNLYPEIEPFIKKQDSENSYGYLMNIYINFYHIQELFKKGNKEGDVFLMPLLRNLCNNINKSLGSVNKLEPKMDTITNTITIYDLATLPGKDKLIMNKKDQYNLEIFGYNLSKSPIASNFVHNAGITTEIPSDYAYMTTIGATAAGKVVGEDATAFSKWNTGIIDRFKKTISTGKSEKILKEDIKKPINKVLFNYYNLLSQGNSNFSNEFTALGLNRQYKSEGEWYSTFVNNLSFLGFYNQYSKTKQKDKDGNEVEGGIINVDSPRRPIFIDPLLINSNLTIVPEFYKEITKKSSRNTKAKSSNGTGFIPFNLNLELDGISGIKIYSKLNIQQSFLPSNYPQSLEFVTTDITHTLNSNKWVTKINTIGMPKNIVTTKDVLNSMFGTYEKLALKLSLPNQITDPTQDINTNTSVDGKNREDIYKNKQLEIDKINKEIIKLGDSEQFNPNIAEGSAYNNINPELQDARDYLKDLKASRAKYGSTVILRNNQL